MDKLQTGSRSKQPPPLFLIGCCLVTMETSHSRASWLLDRTARASPACPGTIRPNHTLITPLPAASPEDSGAQDADTVGGPSASTLPPARPGWWMMIRLSQQFPWYLHTCMLSHVLAITLCPYCVSILALLALHRFVICFAPGGVGVLMVIFSVQDRTWSAVNPWYCFAFWV